MVDDITAHDFRKPQDGQHLFCQKNAHNILLQMPSWPKSYIFRPFKLVMEQKKCTCRGHRKQAPSNHTHLKMFNYTAGIWTFFSPFLSHILASCMKLKSREAVSHPQSDSKAERNPHPHPTHTHTPPLLALSALIPGRLRAPTSLTNHLDRWEKGDSFSQ